ncbi:MAG: YbhB/YbcL family Raf kinase inhibitor-like protein [Thermoproteota archaeon]|jgi:Raf kinase inhibitor-like YbhB/YbcL family protein
MKRAHLVTLVLLLVLASLATYVFINFVITPKPEDIIANVKNQFKVFSQVLKENELIPKKYTVEGYDISPPLNWSGVPSETKSIAVIMYDPDAPSGIFYHWILYNVPAKVSSLSENVSKAPVTSYGLQGINDYGNVGYGGPYPPKGSKHRYVFLILALDKELELKPGAHYSEVLKAIKSHVIAYAKLTCFYER